MKALTAAVLGSARVPPTAAGGVGAGAGAGLSPLSASPPSSSTSAQVVAARLANGCALAVSELAQEPRRGLLLVADHVQAAAPGLLASARGARLAARRIDALSAELGEARAALEALGRVRWPAGGEPGG